MIVCMAAIVHHPGSVPERGAPLAPIFVGSVGIEDKPASLHLGIAEFEASATRHLAFVERQIHMFRRIAVQVIDLQ